MKIAASFSMGRLAPKHDLNIHGSRAMSPNVTPNLIKDDMILVDHLRTHTGAYQSIGEYTDNKLQPYSRGSIKQFYSYCAKIDVVKCRIGFSMFSR